MQHFSIILFVFTKVYKTPQLLNIIFTKWRQLYHVYLLFQSYLCAEMYDIKYFMLWNNFIHCVCYSAVFSEGRGIFKQLEGINKCANKSANIGELGLWFEIVHLKMTVQEDAATWISCIVHTGRKCYLIWESAGLCQIHFRLRYTLTNLSPLYL